MSAQPEEPAVETPPVSVQPRGNSRLAQLHAAYADARATADAADKQLKAITDAIKLELTQTDPNAQRFDLMPAKGVEAPVLRLTYTESWRLDSRKLKAEHPETWVRYASKSGSWRLAAAQSRGGEG